MAVFGRPNLGGAATQVLPISHRYVKEAALLWKHQLSELEPRGIPSSWFQEIGEVEAYISDHAKQGQGVVLTSGDALLGFMLYDAFQFHGAQAAFSPVTAHAAEKSVRYEAYTLMYAAIAGEWVEQRCLDHFISFFPQDDEMQDLLFHLGFGAYVLDAFRNLKPVAAQKVGLELRIEEAGYQHLSDLMLLGEESRAYYLATPIFLRREALGHGFYEKLIDDKSTAIFLAYVQGSPVGFFNIRANDTVDPITLCDTATGVLDPLGAFIQPQFRGQGIGKLLLDECVSWAANQGLRRVHVDFESANVLGRHFWTKHFTPAICSVRRKVNEDVLANT